MDNLHFEIFNCESPLFVYKCKYCNFMANLWITLDDHIWKRHKPPRNLSKTASEIRIYTCTCNFKTYSLIVYHLHKVKCHLSAQSAPEEKLYKCKLCDFRSRYQHSLQLHCLRRHIDSKCRTEDTEKLKIQVVIDPEGEESEEKQNQTQGVMEMNALYAAADHNYHKGHPLLAPMCLRNPEKDLTLDPPIVIDSSSSSEEEIDVETLDEAHGAEIRLMQEEASTEHSAKPKEASAKHSTKPKEASANHSTKPKEASANHRTKPKEASAKHSTKPKEASEKYVIVPESSDKQKRLRRNYKEKLRQVNLYALFNNLQKLVPSTKRKRTASKTLILKGAIEYCTQLRHKGETLAGRVEALRQRQAVYRAHLSKLLRDTAGMRHRLYDY